MATSCLPIYFKSKEQKTYRTTVLRCSFDGTQLTYREHGSELTIDDGRGLYEPSLTRFGDRFYLTLRNDSAGYVAVSTDGLHFEAPQKWLWDDGTELGNYNTQQHWVTHSDGLFLVYTRKGANNDHVFRHRAPLFIAQVDPLKLRVIRRTERDPCPRARRQARQLCRDGGKRARDLGDGGRVDADLGTERRHPA